MGLLDFLRSTGARKRDVAREIDVGAGVLTRCPICGEATDRGDHARMPEAEAEAQARFERDDPSVGVFRGNREELLELLYEVRDAAEWECLCDKGG